MTRTPLISIACVLIASMLGALGQFLFKTASDRATGGMPSVLLSPWALAGMACYVTVMGFFTYAFRKGGTVTVLYPVYATTFIWAAVFALMVYNDPIKPVHLAGMVLLVAGIYLMAV